jgi:hypothetical protein
VTGNHVFGEEGSYRATVKFVDDGNTPTPQGVNIVTGMLIVGDAALRGTGQNFSAVEGTAGASPFTLGTITDSGGVDAWYQ